MSLARLMSAVVLALAVACGGARAQALGADHVKAELAAQTRGAVPGSSLYVALVQKIDRGWHTYWRNPGDSGLPTEIAWDLPAGFSAGDADWPVPERFVLNGIGNYGYQGSADLLVPIAAPADLKPDSTIHFAAHATWLVCAEICIPGEAKLALDLPAAAAPLASDPASASLIAAVRDRLPQAAKFRARFAVSGKELRLFIPEAALAGLDRASAAFFPLDPNVVDAAAEPKEERGADGLAVVMARASGLTAAPPPERLGGVLVLRDAGSAERRYSISAPRAATLPVDTEPSIGWLAALALAIIGGIVLNLMPCVFPVLSLKLIGLAEAVHRAEQWQHGLAYAAGVILSFALLGGVLLVLRAGGGAIGWGFQLQSPVVVGLLAYLLLAMGLGLSGVAEFGAALTGTGNRFAGGAGLAGAFATGILATIVATPCTAPFMGAALGAALIAPAPVALLIFVALGIGLALPLVLAAAIPGLARRLPRPGAWMVWFKQLLAFPLYATVAWLIWVLIQEVGPAGALTALFGLVAVGFTVWIYGRTRTIGPTGRRLGAGLAAGGIAAARRSALSRQPG
jgi:thiol:disulfide interchange protein DsbD